MVKTNSEKLKSFMRLNKVARERKAIKEGFRTGTEYLASLKSEKSSKTENEKATSKKKPAKSSKKVLVPTIHVVDIVDRSGSMSGQKLQAAISGVNQGVDALKKEEGVNYTHTLCIFDNQVDVLYSKTELKNVPKFKTTARNTTALYDAIGITIEEFNVKFVEDEKVLVNIYTDGHENASRTYNAREISALIEKLSAKGFTFSFIGTKQDTEAVVNTLKIDKSNTLSYDGTGAGLAKSMADTISARSTYTASVKRGEDVSKGFYKDFN
jgi:uncharacterized protein YegL